LEIFFHAQPQLVERSAIALGFFDGVHPGHQVVIKKAVEESRRLGVRAGVVTFRDHPRGLIRGASPLLLTVIEQRLDLFASLGVEVALVLTFSEELCQLSPGEYVEQVLVESMGAKSISVGHNHHFGRDREGNAELLSQFGQKRDFVVHAAPMIYVENLEVSSSRIRKMIQSKDLELANKLLSRPFALRGEVVQGAQRGRVLGFPTANLLPASNQLVPPVGVYVGTVKLIGSKAGGIIGAEDGAEDGLEGCAEDGLEGCAEDGVEGCAEDGVEGCAQDGLEGCAGTVYLPAVINIGYRPTFAKSQADLRKNQADLRKNQEGNEDEKAITIEAHLLDFQGDLYGRQVEIGFLKFLRDEQKFDGLAALTNQITQDCQVARCYLKECLAKS
jgi:riboflavin kinase/FMN adenylyltransferase